VLESKPNTFDDDGVRWQISSFSGGGSCVAVARLGQDTFAVRNSNQPMGGLVVLSGRELEGLLLGVKAGEFDDLAV
jgi:hypothetical protein